MASRPVGDIFFVLSSVHVAAHFLIFYDWRIFTTAGCLPVLYYCQHITALLGMLSLLLSWLTDNCFCASDTPVHFA